MTPSWRAIRPCTRCGETFEPTRQEQGECQPCRRRRAMQRHAAKRLAQLRPMLTAVENLRLWVEAEISGWEDQLAEQRPRRKKSFTKL